MEMTISSNNDGKCSLELHRENLVLRRRVLLDIVAKVEQEIEWCDEELKKEKIGLCDGELGGSVV